MAILRPAKVGETRVLWATDFEELEEGPYETVAVLIETEYHGQQEYYWQLSNGEQVMANGTGEPLYSHELAETEEEGYNNCITVLRDRIAAMRDAIAFLESQRDTSRPEDLEED